MFIILLVGCYVNRVLITGVGNDDDWGIISLCGNIKFWLMKGFYSDEGRKDSYREDVMRCGELS